jgi:hypothetical protein
LQINSTLTRKHPQKGNVVIQEPVQRSSLSPLQQPPAMSQGITEAFMLEMRETFSMMQVKISKMEQLIELKDKKIEELTQKLLEKS